MIEKNNKNIKKGKFYRTKKKNKNEEKVNKLGYNDLRKNKKVNKKSETFKNFKKNKLETNQKFKNKTKTHFNNKYNNKNRILNNYKEVDSENSYDNCNSGFDEDKKEENNLNNNENITSDLNIKNRTVDYVDYINMIKNSDEYNLDKIKKEYDENNDINNEKVFKIFLIFSPLAITSIKNKSCLINADDHMTLFEKKLKNLENLMKIESNDNNKKNIKKKIDSVKNKLDNIRSDVLFYTLLCLRDSILNKKQKLQIYIYTINNLLIYVSPLFRIPRNFTLFKKVMLSLLKKGELYDDNKQILLKILPHSIKYYIGNTVCVGISNDGFPTDAKKFADKVKKTNNDYSFFVSLSYIYDVTKFIEIIKKKESEEFSFDYLIRLSDLKLSPITICSKLTYFLN
ncbi:small subunit rRNA processing factor, putative [Plasmodium gallinaceum]|uniref:Small subunit rRNA processing factor, putative n=1 Tax=Plasmodium gallinaceum TaxID=5849 RepID=A0A1J1GQJ8_PLAGA|nr:small subunit rRNA processing factor, putative [Plasmodium gallinaceum]CRG93559.1 small subunit rRNA processing factor, putative [Plasmodium gallinaceum]